MNLDEKITHLREVVMSEARAEGNAIIENHRKALESLLDKHKEEAKTQSEIRIKSETTKSRRQGNQAAAKGEVELKRALGKRQKELKIKLFEEVKVLLLEYRKSDDYVEYICRKIREAAVFANGDGVVIYITPSDEDKKAVLESKTGMTITVSEYEFMGGVRAVIQNRNILIDHSFQTAIEAEYQRFSFGTGGAGVE